MTVNLCEHPVNLWERKEPLLPNHSLMLAGESCVVALAFGKKNTDPTSMNRRSAFRLIDEYRSIKDIFTAILGEKRVAEISDCSFPALSYYYHTWPRNAHLEVDDHVFVYPKAWTVKDGRIKKSPLGNGGAARYRRNVLLTTKKVYIEMNPKDQMELRAKNIKVGLLPLVDPAKQSGLFRLDDIDCHVTLIETAQGGLELLVARSYYEQSFDAGKMINAAGDSIEASLKVVDDRNSPPLAFNLVQLDDLSVVMTSGATKLEEYIAGLVGSERVFTTAMPIIEIPKRGKGNIGCLTNVAPNFLISSQSSVAPNK